MALGATLFAAAIGLTSCDFFAGALVFNNTPEAVVVVANENQDSTVVPPGGKGSVTARASNRLKRLTFSFSDDASSAVELDVDTKDRITVEVSGPPLTAKVRD